MKKKIVSTLLCASMAATMLAGCGGSTSDTSKSDGGDASVSSNDGKVLNIYCWNEEFKSRITDHYPDYEEVDSTHGKIGDVDVVWNITPNDDNAYQNNLDATLVKQNDASADDKIDLFLIEADYALKYVDSDYTVPIKDLGIADSDTSKQYQYTKDVVTDSDGVLKGLSWQGCPGVLFYNREAAKEVLGTDDPEEVQKSVSDWDTFNATAEKMKAAGYKMTSTVNDTYRVYSNNVSEKWVSDDNKIQIDDNIMKWVDDSKELVDAGETGTSELWSDDWKKGFYPEGKVFCYFGPAWLVNFSMAADEAGSIGNQGGWGAAQGPQGFFWGGTWICAAAGTDNPNLIKEIMQTMTCDKDTEVQITKDTQDYTNTISGMNELANSNFKSDFLGGQNHIKLFAEAAPKINMKNISAYDQGLNEEFQKAMKDYFDGNVTKDKALDNFYKAATEKYPNLTH